MTGSFFFFKMWFYFLIILFTINVILLYEIVQYDECLFSIVGTDGLVLLHQDISSHSADYTPMRFPVFEG